MRFFKKLLILITVICLCKEQSFAAPKNVAEIRSSEKRETETTIPPTNALVISQNTNKQSNNNRNTYNDGVDIDNDGINNTNRSAAIRSTPPPNPDVNTVVDYDDHHIAITKPYFGSTHAATKFIFSTWPSPAIALYDDFPMWTRPNNKILRNYSQSITNSTMTEKSRRVWDSIAGFGRDQLQSLLKEKLIIWKNETFTPENKTYMIIATSALVIALFVWAFAVYYCCYDLILQVRTILKCIQDSETTKCDPDVCPYGNLQ